MKNIFGRAILIALISLPGLSTFAAPAGLATPENCEWKLRQHHDHLGEFELYVSTSAIKAVSLDWNFQVVGKAPDWKVHCFRPSNKTEWVAQMADFSGEMLESPFETSAVDSERNIAAGKGVMKGLKYTRYSPDKRSLNALYGADEISISPQGAEFISRLWGFPDQRKVPIYRCRYKNPPKVARDSWVVTDAGTDQRTGLVIEFVTRSWQKLPFKIQDFELPQGYKQLSRLSDVTFSNKRKDNLTEMFGNFSASGDKLKDKTERKPPK